MAHYGAIWTDLKHNIENAKKLLEMPVLALGGEMSFGERAVSSARRIAKDVRGRSMPRCAHWVAEEEPEALLAELLASSGKSVPFERRAQRVEIRASRGEEIDVLKSGRGLRSERLDGGEYEADPLGFAARWRAEGRSVALATVVETWGSSPCPPGSQLAINEQGHFEGSVSGGCVEGAVIERAAAVIESGTARDPRVRDRRRDRLVGRTRLWRTRPDLRRARRSMKAG